MRVLGRKLGTCHDGAHHTFINETILAAVKFKLSAMKFEKFVPRDVACGEHLSFYKRKGPVE